MFIERSLFQSVLRWALTLSGLAAAASCQTVPLLAPTGSTISLTTPVTALPVNGTASLSAQVVEASGTPPHEGTTVNFFTTLGTIQPTNALTDVAGRATAMFLAGPSSGIASISASSGNASTGAVGAVKIAVGAAAASRVTINASPASLPALGGTTTVTATVFDINGNALQFVPVSFTTTAGTLSSALATTNANGAASTSLTTSLQATVTATVGAQGSTSGGGSGSGGGTTPTPTPSGQATASVVVTVSSGPTLVIVPPTTPPSAGLPASFTFTVTLAAQNGSAVRDLTVNWGDGTQQDLGAVNGSALVTHVYLSPGTYIVTGIVTDAGGNTNRVSTSVSVIPIPRPTIIITPTPQSAPSGTLINFTLNITVPAGLAIEDVLINFGDGTSQDLGGFSGVVTLTHTYGPGIRSYTVTVDVTDSTGQTTRGTTVVSMTS
jgi:hypothetical protein